MSKNIHAVALGKLGGQKGGKSQSAAKVAAVRKNLAKARQAKKPVDSNKAV